MKIHVSEGKSFPDFETAKQDLEQRFPEYNVKSFGWGPGKSVLVCRSLFVAGRVTLREKKRELIVSGFFGNLWVASLLSGLLFPIFFRKKWGEMEAIVGDYVSNRWGS